MQIENIENVIYDPKKDDIQQIDKKIKILCIHRRDLDTIITHSID